MPINEIISPKLQDAGRTPQSNKKEKETENNSDCSLSRTQVQDRSLPQVYLLNQLEQVTFSQIHFLRQPLRSPLGLQHISSSPIAAVLSLKPAPFTRSLFFLLIFSPYSPSPYIPPGSLASCPNPSFNNATTSARTPASCPSLCRPRCIGRSFTGRTACSSCSPLPRRRPPKETWR